MYLPFENQSDITELLRKLPDFQFYQYSSGLTDGRQDNVHLRKACHGGFMRDLCSSRAVICNAGFELVSEALQLGLQILVKPLHGQPEQLSNAAALTHLDLGTRVNSLNREFIADWLDELPATDRNATSTSYPDVAAALVDWIADGQNDNPATLVERLWLQCRQSEYSEAMTPQFAK